MVDSGGGERVRENVSRTDACYERRTLLFQLFTLKLTDENPSLLKISYLQYLKQLNSRLNEVVTLMGSDTLTNNDRKKIDMVLTLDVHMKDIVEGFVRDSIIDPAEFEWESQLRFVSILIGRLNEDF